MRNDHVNPSTSAATQSLIDSIPRLISDRVALLSLEMRRATRALAIVTVLVIGAAVFFATAWVGLWFGIASALAAHGLSNTAIAAVVVILNVLMVGLCIRLAGAQAPLIAIPATLRRLTLAPRGEEGERMATDLANAPLKSHEARGR